MTSHELAAKLLTLPNLPVVCIDGGDPSDFAEINSNDLEVVDASVHWYWSKSDRVKEGKCIQITSF